MSKIIINKRLEYKNKEKYKREGGRKSERTKERKKEGTSGRTNERTKERAKGGKNGRASQKEVAKFDSRWRGQRRRGRCVCFHQGKMNFSTAQLSSDRDLVGGHPPLRLVTTRRIKRHARWSLLDIAVRVTRPHTHT